MTATLPTLSPVAIVNLGTYDSGSLLSKAVRNGGKFAVEFSTIEEMEKPGTVIFIRTITEARRVFKDLRSAYDMAEVREYQSEDPNDYKTHFSGWL